MHEPAPKHMRATSWLWALCGAGYVHSRPMRVKWKTTTDADAVTCLACKARHPEVVTIAEHP